MRIRGSGLYKVKNPTPRVEVNLRRELSATQKPWSPSALSEKASERPYFRGRPTLTIGSFYPTISKLLRRGVSCFHSGL